MSVRNLPTDDQILDLLALRAAEGLDRDDEVHAVSLDDPGVFDAAAAVLAIGMTARDGIEPMPPMLRQRLEALAEDFATPVPAPAPIVSTASSRTLHRPEPARVPWMASAGWLAAAACLILAVVVWNPPRTPEPGIDARLAALEMKPGVVKTDWLSLDAAGLSESPHAYDKNLKGQIVWDPQTNEGYMVFEGLASNDPSALQYQLWIFDADRPTGQLPQYGEGILSQRPVDGGVFDIPTDGRVVVPITPKLSVGKAAVFAVTVEPPGGVVVSDRDIVAVAMVN
ncbi:MAG: anti-sigma factor [Phycisphaerales bacterium]|nr:anti-sigma factor [Planctomycetota bacterium]MCH8507920.1 anti-sigma factor [Phycisphaerales bacterium]